MALRKIVTEGDEVLRKVCAPITQITPKFKELAADMLETMRDAEGVGLAGPQVGVPRRIIVVETVPGEVYTVINPVITASSGEQEGNEGCLSIPGESGCVRRPMNVTVEGLDIEGNPVKIEATEFLARAFCHEIDHLEGRLYTDIALYMNDPEGAEKTEPARYRRFGRRK